MFMIANLMPMQFRGPVPKRQVDVRIYAVLVLLTEPGSTTVDEKVNGTEKSQKFQV